MVKNARALADAFIARGLDVVSGGTDNHLVLLDLRRTGLSGKALEERLDQVNITTNKNKIPGDPASAVETSGLRLGSPAVTTRGFKEAEMEEVAELIYMAIKDFEGNKDAIKARVAALCKRFPIYQ